MSAHPALGPLQVMKQNLRISQADPRIPKMYEVPLQPKGGGNIVAMIYGESDPVETMAIAERIVRAANSATELQQVCEKFAAAMRRQGQDHPCLLELIEVLHQSDHALGEITGENDQREEILHRLDEEFAAAKVH